MSNELSRKCPQCGAPIQEDAPAELCPGCLMALNLKTETVFTGDTPAVQPPLSPAELAPHFPQLEIIECLGRGGMGVVYRARQKSLNRFVALKLLAPERAGDPSFAARFEKEAQALAALNHPHIVAVHDFGQAGGFYFLLMEFVDGVNLRQLLRARKLKPEEALAIVPPVCEALQYAHEHGIVHRDIKPENLLLDKEGRVKIADFGVAKILGAAPLAGGPSDSQPAGTPQYMAPEQKDHRATDHRADIYSLGVVLYEMLTGELPADKLQPPSRRVQVDIRIDEIVLRALEKKPELRFATAAEFRTQVVAAASGGSGRESAPSESSTESQGRLPPAAPGESRLSPLAVSGACWVPVPPVALATAYLLLAGSRQGASPSWLQLCGIIPLLGIAVVGPFGTTILGWLAVAQIRRSGGRLHGLTLAVFDGLVFPLMALSALVAVAGVALAKMFVDFYANPSLIGNPAIQPPPLTGLANGLSQKIRLVVPLAVLVAVVVDVFIVRAVLRAVRKDATAAPREASATDNQTKLASLAVLFALMSAAFGAFAAVRSAVPSSAMAAAFFFAGVAIFMALPARRTGAGVSALIIAALGMVIWPGLALVAQRGRPAPPAESPGPEIERVQVSNEQAVVKARGSDNAGLIFLFGTGTNRWTPGGLYLEAMFDVSLTSGGFERGVRWNITARHGTFARYRLEGPPGSLVGKVVFHPGKSALEADGSYVIGEFRPDKGESLPIAVRLDRAKPAPTDEDQSPARTNAQMVIPGHIDFKVIRVENPPGSPVISLLFERDKNYGLGLEFSQDVIAGPGEKMPRPGYRDFREKTFLGVNGGNGFAWKLPEEFSGEEARAVAKEVEATARKYPQLNDGALIEFAHAKHRDGWTYVLLARVLREPGAPQTPAANETATFTLRHMLARNMEVALRQVFRDRADCQAKATSDDRSIIVTAPPEVMTRVRTFIAVNDATDTLAREEPHGYPQFTPLVTARAFLHACAIEEADDVIASLLSVGVLAELRGDRTPEYEAFQKTGVADAKWEASLRADWPGKPAALRQLAREWNRHPLVSLAPAYENGAAPRPAIAAVFLGAPASVSYLHFQSTVVANETNYFIDSLPPSWPGQPRAGR